MVDEVIRPRPSRTNQQGGARGLVRGGRQEIQWLWKYARSSEGCHLRHRCLEPTSPRRKSVVQSSQCPTPDCIWPHGRIGRRTLFYGWHGPWTSTSSRRQGAFLRPLRVLGADFLREAGATHVQYFGGTVLGLYVASVNMTIRSAGIVKTMRLRLEVTIRSAGIVKTLKRRSSAQLVQPYCAWLPW